MVRILKPNGFIFVTTLFSWRYHTSPIDFWRFTPHCLAYLFEGLECVEANWNISNRRGLDEDGIQGKGDANDVVPEDNMGAWRENWRVYYVGRKNGD